ncbi:hypothetical protein [Thermococcus peptonophilus]|uniref:hypothetical protein n=1 Tax=Thermococcus peptonophilus TaxID=53952 RepID=UPI0006CF6695
MSWEEAKKFIAEREYALILTPELTNEEISFFKEFAQKRGISIGSTVEGELSTATLEDIRKAKRVLLKADPEKYPLLKLLLRDKVIVGGEDYDVAILEGPAEPLEAPDSNSSRGGVNAAGLIRAGITGGIPESKAYVVVGRTEKELKGGDVLILPAGVWAAKEGGTVTNALGMELKVRKALEGYSPPLGLFS